ncbi:MAG: beta-hydroxyacyl-ACP dehydratase [Myxococcales bacterium]|nr:beta-hydroxyacyl-ACP dehydratase [Myxococcales bacterium]
MIARRSMRWRLVDRIDELERDRFAAGRVSFSPDLELFQDHFPGFAVVPGVILMESLAQLAGKLVGYSVRLARGDWPFPILSMMQAVKFRRFVRPGEVVRLEARVLSLRDESAVMDVRAWVDGRIVAQAEQTFVFNAVKLDSDAEAERLERIERSELARLWPAYPHD